jgi:aerobic carbon-monoxide dehydrogenase medium subunit
MYTMRPAQFEYHRPSTVEEAVALLGDEEARPLAGGHSLLPLMKMRLSTPGALVDLAGLGLDSIEEDGDDLVIGAMVTHEALTESDLVRRRVPLLAEAAGEVGDRQVRRRGTIGGSVAHADPAADYPTVLRALGATMLTQGRDGERSIPADDCFVGVFQTAIGAGELLTAVRVPGTPAGTGAAYLKHRHPASRYSVVGAAAVVTREGGRTSRVRLAVGGATATPVDASSAAESLVGGDASDAALDAVAERIPPLLSAPITDTYASGEYRVHLAKVLARRALSKAMERAG